MLLQSHSGVINIFPAIPSEWKDVRFNNLRAMGAFLVSSEMKDGKVIHLSVKAEKGGKMRIYIPTTGKVVEYDMKAGKSVKII